MAGPFSLERVVGNEITGRAPRLSEAQTRPAARIVPAKSGVPLVRRATGERVGDEKRGAEGQEL
jgi:hypothetical protein